MNIMKHGLWELLKPLTFINLIILKIINGKITLFGKKCGILLEVKM